MTLPQATPFLCVSGKSDARFSARIGVCAGAIGFIGQSKKLLSVRNNPNKEGKSLMRLCALRVKVRGYVHGGRWRPRLAA